MKVIVIGGGVIGLATAYYLVEGGNDVTLIERHADVGRGASLANGGQLSYSYVAPLASPAVFSELPSLLFRRSAPVEVSPRFDPSQWKWLTAFLGACTANGSRLAIEKLLPLAFYSRDLLRELSIKHSVHFSHRKAGKLVLYSTQSTWASALRQLEYQRSLGCEQHALTPAECCEKEPSIKSVQGRIAGGIFTPSDEIGDCHQFCLELKRILQKSGKFVLLRSVSATGIRRLGRKVVAVDTSSGPVEGDAYVLAAGVESRSLAHSVGIDLPIYPLRGFSITVPLEKPENGPQHSITDYQNKIVYAPIGGALRVAGFVEIGGYDSAVNERRISTLESATLKLFPHLRTRAASAWCGLRPATPTGLPIIRRSKYENLFLNVGQGGLGFTVALASGSIVTDLVERKDPKMVI